MNEADLMDPGEAGLYFVYHVLGPVDELPVYLGKTLETRCLDDMPHE